MKIDKPILIISHGNFLRFITKLNTKIGNCAVIKSEYKLDKLSRINHVTSKIIHQGYLSNEIDIDKCGCKISLPSDIELLKD